MDDTTSQTFPVTSADFEARVLDASRSHPVLVDFWAAWCGPCRALAPVLERLAAEYAGRVGIAKVDADAEPALASRFGVRSLPTLALFRDAKIVDGVIGAQPESQLRGMIERHLERPGDRARDAAQALARAGNVDGALPTLRQLVATEPDRPQHYLALLDVLLDAGRLGEATEAIRHAPLAFEGDAELSRRRSRLALLEAAARNAADAEGPARAESGAARTFLDGRHGEAIEAWLDALRSWPREGRRTIPALLKAAFELMGEEHELVATSRRRLAALMH